MENFPWTLSPASLCDVLQTHLEKGLSVKAIQDREKEFGANQIPEKRKSGILKLFLDQFSSLIVWLLIGAALIAGFLGQGIDFWAITGIILLNAILGFVQEFRAENALEKLQKLAAPYSKVIREGKLEKIAAEKIVPGDLVLLEAGDTVPADGRLVDVQYLLIEEASLTGESVPVSKLKDSLFGNLPIGDRKNMAFLGTTILQGKGKMLVTHTGLSTEMGKIASKLLDQEKEETPLHHQLNRLGKRLVYLCLGIVGFVFLLGLLRGSPPLDMLLTSLSLAVAAIPEGLPAAVTISLSLGVRKMAEKKALVRRLSSVETLGSTSVICTDKTGTLTQNVMTVRKIWIDQTWIDVSESGYTPQGEFSTVTPDLYFALKIGVLCNGATLLQEKGKWAVLGDPTEGALLVAAAKKGFFKEKLEEEYPFLEEIPFDAKERRMSVLRSTEKGNIWFVKGAPETIIPRAKKWLRNGREHPIQMEEILTASENLASEAYRVLALAYQMQSNSSEKELIFVALIAMRDPPREEVKGAIQICKQAGIDVVMVTGDHKKTAIAIAKELGMEGGKACDGIELENLSEQEIRNTHIFSRISPEHKLKIVEAFKRGGEVTAMTGDGVNDAPAVKAADIGIAMGMTGTDVTKSSSDMILLDDNFATIVAAIEQGRGIYDNILKFVSYLLSSNIAEILVIFIVMLFGIKGQNGPFLPLLPVQLLWMNLITDGFPAVSLALDPVDPLAMKRKPRSRSQEVLHFRFGIFVFLVSLVVTAGALAACFYGLKTSFAAAQTMTFTTLIVLELVRLQMIRQQFRMKFFSNPFLLVALAISFVLQIGVLYFPSFQVVFGTVPLSWKDWGVIIGIAFGLWALGSLVAKRFDPHQSK